MHDFIVALVGGMMIGLAAVLLMVTHGKIMGISGIVNRVLPPTDSDWKWRAMFIAGIVSAPLAYIFLTGQQLDISVSNDTSLLIFAGLLVGIGTTVGNGCTSGHGVCGLPRLSVRSIIATSVFMLAGFVTVFVVRHVIGV